MDLHMVHVAYFFIFAYMYIWGILCQINESLTLTFSKIDDDFYYDLRALKNFLLNFLRFFILFFLKIWFFWSFFVFFNITFFSIVLFYYSSHENLCFCLRFTMKRCTYFLITFLTSFTLNFWQKWQKFWIWLSMSLFSTKKFFVFYN